MSISSFNKGLDDAYMGNSPKNKYGNDIDYVEGYQYGEDIDAKIDYEIEMRKEYEDYMIKQAEEYWRNFKED